MEKLVKNEQFQKFIILEKKVMAITLLFFLSKII